MKYYDNYINNVYKKPIDNYHSLTDSFIDSQWNDSTLLATVGEETAHGSFEFKDIEVWKNTVTNFDVRMLKNEKDYRRLLFKTLGREIERGRYYNFDDNYWLTYEPTTYEAPYCDVLVRRCNNTAKWLDIDTGEIIEMPCVLEYDFTSTTPTINKDVIVANTSVVLAMQGNEKTLKLQKNQRFIFNGTAYKFMAYNNYMQEDYLSKDINMLFMDIDLDIIKPTDDLERGIADIGEFDIQVSISENPIEQLQGYMGVLTSNITLNGEDYDKSVVWTSNENATILQNGVYELVGEVGEIALITATFGSYSDTVAITITDAIVENKEISVSPTIDEISLHDKVTLVASMYINGEVELIDIQYETSGASEDCYNIIQTGNAFEIENLKQSNEPLNIRFYAEDIESTVSIMLTALF